MNYERNIKILTWQGFLIGFSLWSPIAAIYFSKVSGSYALGLSIFSMAMVSSAIFEIPTGIFSDLIGRKYTTILGGFFYMLGGIFYALGFNYWWLVIGAVCEGLARAFYSGNNDALLYDSLQKSDRKEELAKFMGHIGGAEQWALGITALLGGILAAKFSFTLVMWLSVIPLFLCFFTSWWLAEVKNTKVGEGNVYIHLKEAIKNFIKNEKLRLLSLTSIIGFGTGEAGFQFTPVFIQSIWPLWAIGLARTLSNVGAALGFNLSGRMVKRFKAVNILIFEQIYSRLASIIAFVFPSVVSPILLSSTSLMYGPSMVAENSLFQKEFSDKQRATMGSLNSLGKSIFFGVILLILGIVADKTNPRAALILGQILAIVAVWLTWKLKKLFSTAV